MVIVVGKRCHQVGARNPAPPAAAREEKGREEKVDAEKEAAEPRQAVRSRQGPKSHDFGYRLN
jgi:hypothetical protein